MERLFPSRVESTLYPKYFEAIVCEDAEALAGVAKDFEMKYYPFARDLAQDANLIARTVMLGNTAPSFLAEGAFLRATRSYAYSGLQFYPKPVLFAASLLNISDEVVKTYIRPDSYNLHMICNETMITNKNKLIAVGRKVIEALDYTQP